MDFGNVMAHVGEFAKDVGILAGIVAFAAAVVYSLERATGNWGNERRRRA